MIEHWAALLSRRVAGPQFLQTDVVATHVVELCNSMQAPLFSFVARDNSSVVETSCAIVSTPNRKEGGSPGNVVPSNR